MKTAVLQLWQHRSVGSPEDEAGCSLHLSVGDRRKFVRRYWEKMPGRMPQHFEAEFGKPVRVRVSDILYEEVQKHRAEFGMRLALLPEELQKLVPVEFTSLNTWCPGHMSAIL
ncbi:MAG: hypothetical protein Q8Q17_02785 [bacterium]|nr:hypothetical protein [bacterium]